MKKKIKFFLLALLVMLICIPTKFVLAAEATSNPTLIVESKYAASGTGVEVNISVLNNTGIAGAKISVSYSDRLTLIDAVSGDTFAALDYTAPPDYISSCCFNWDSLDAEVTEDGVLLTLTFETFPGAVANEELNIDVAYHSGDIYNIELDSVEFDIVNGSITILDYIPGDINGDKVLNGKDVTLLRRYNAGYNVTINMAAADTNNDGVINGKDVTLIRRHNAGYNVELKPSTQKCNHTMEAIAFKAATCTEEGNISYYHCNSCDKYYNDSNGTVEIVLANTILPAIDHTWGEWENQSQTTLRFCTNDCGNYQRMTSITASYNGIRLLTGESVHKTDVSVMAKLDNGTEEIITDFELDNSIMTKEGNNIVMVDFMSLETTVAVPAIYDNLPGTTAISEFEYTVKNDAVTITGFVGESTDIVIPAHIDRIPVRSVGYQAFNGCGLLESITIPDSVTTIGNQAFYGCKSLTNIVIPASVKTIGEYAFYECTKLQSVIIGDNEEQLELTKIGFSAFQKCTSLKQVTIGNGVSTVSSSTFKGCTSLERVSMGDSVSTLGYEAFYGCEILADITFGDKLATIGDKAFYGCKSLANIVIPANVKTIGEYAFYECTKLQSATIGDDAEQLELTKIGASAFQKCTSLKEVEIGNGVSTVSSYAFKGCTSLECVSLGNSVSTLGYEAFYGCVLLKSINLADGIVKIDSRAFLGCELLTDITFGNKLTTIGDQAFEGCKSLTDIVIPSNVTTIGDSAFYECIRLEGAVIGDEKGQINPTTIASYAFSRCTSLKEVRIGNGVSTVSSYAFKGCTSLECVSLGSSVSTLGYEAFYGCVLLKSINLADGIVKIDSRAFLGCELLTDITFGNKLTTIGDQAFEGCKSITNIVIPANVKTIGEYAFYECLRLQSATIGDDAEQLELTEIEFSAFQKCTSLKQVTIGNGVGTVSSSVFKGCTSLERVSLGDSVGTLGYEAFYGCVSLKSINLCGGIEKIAGSAFYGCEILADITFGDKLTTIGDKAFYGCKSLTNIVIPANVKTIGEYAFYECLRLQSATIGDDAEQLELTEIEFSAFQKCTSLKQITIGNGVGTVSSSAFKGCTSLQRVSLGDSVGTLGYEAFYGCELLTDITFDDKLITIGDKAFYGCKSLTGIVIPVSVKTIGEYAFYECIKLQSVVIGDKNEQINLTTIEGSAFSRCTSLKQVVIGNGVSTISSNSFNGCTSLERVSLGDSVTTLGYRAFYGCEILADITFGDKLTTIGDNAFYGCKSLTNIVIPANVKTIGEYAFYECTKLQSVVIGDKNEQINPTTIEGSAFSRCTSLKKVTIGNGVKTIPSNAFYGCAALESISLGSNITSIGYQAFYNCTSLATINYAGTEEAWNLITKNNDWDKNTGTYTIKYNCNIEAVETYTVTFKDYDGTVLKTQSGVTKGAAATAPDNPAREGYTFAGWDKVFNNVTSDMVVTATYTPVASGECTHTNKTFVDNLYEDIKYIDATSHSVKVISQYMCPDCKAAITDTANAIVKTEEHVHDFAVNGGWVCRCGHIQDVAFEAYTANLQSDVNRTTYYDPELTIRYGTVYVSDEITVIGTTDSAYLIKYPLDAGGYKFAFIAKKYIDKQSYVKNSNLNVFVNGKTVSAVNNNEKVYANLNELMNAFGEEAYFVTEQDDYNLTIKVRNSKNREYYTLNIELTDYMTKNWANVYATKDGETGNVPGFCVGAYVYTDDVFIELQELMDLLEYQSEENCYVPSDFTVNLRLYSNALRILNGGANFDAQYESLPSEFSGWMRSLLYRLATGEWGNIISTHDYYSDDELVEAIKQMLFDRSYPVDTSQIEANYEVMQALGGLFSILEDGTDAIGLTMGEWEYRFAAILREDGFGELFGNLKDVCENFSEMMGKIENGIKNIEFSKMMIEEVAVMVTLQFQYEENIAVLELLIENETDPKVIAIYEKVKKELMAYYCGQATGVFHTWTTDEKIREKVVEGIVDFCVEEAKDDFMKKTALSNPYYVAYEITCFLANEVFNGEKLYDAQDGIYKIHNTLELYIPSLRDAIDDYYDNPITENAKRVIASSVIAAELRIQAADYCIDYAGNKVYYNDTEAFENEKHVLEAALQNIKKIFAELS